MSVIVSLITGASIVYSCVCWGADHRKYQSFASLAYVRGIHRWPVSSPHKGPVTQQMLMMCPWWPLWSKSVTAFRWRPASFNFWPHHTTGLKILFHRQKNRGNSCIYLHTSHNRAGKLAPSYIFYTFLRLLSGILVVFKSAGGQKWFFFHGFNGTINCNWDI